MGSSFYGNGAACFHLGKLLSAGAVSYTHLDVYKRQDVDARHVRQNHRGRNGRRARQLLRNNDRQIAAADLQHALRFAHANQFRLGQTALEASIDNRHRRRNRALLADNLLDLSLIHI